MNLRLLSISRRTWGTSTASRPREIHGLTGANMAATETAVITAWKNCRPVNNSRLTLRPGFRARSRRS